MENQQQSSRDSCDSLALARKHVRALTEGGVSREALLRALLEQEEANSSLAPLPSQGATHVQSKKPMSLSRTASLSQPRSHSQWSSSTKGKWLSLSSHLPGNVQIHPVFAKHDELIVPQGIHLKRVTDHQVQISSQPCRRPTPPRGLAPAQEAAICRHTLPLHRSRQGQVPSLSFLAMSWLELNLHLLAQEHTGAHRESYSKSSFPSAHDLTPSTSRTSLIPSADAIQNSSGSSTGRGMRMSFTSDTRSILVLIAIAYSGERIPSTNITRHVTTVRRVLMRTKSSNTRGKSEHGLADFAPPFCHPWTDT